MKGTKSQEISVLTNHFKVALKSNNGDFYQYKVAFFYEDGTRVEAKGVVRRLLDILRKNYSYALGGREFVYDGENLFTMHPLPNNELKFGFVVESMSSNRTVHKRSKLLPQSKYYGVEIKDCTMRSTKAILDAFQDHESNKFNEAARLLDALLRECAAKQGCLLVRQYFFQKDPTDSISIGGGVFGSRGFHSRFRSTQAGLSLNMDVSTTMTVRPGKVVDFLLENQNVQRKEDIDWIKAKRMLKSLWIKRSPSNLEHKITGLSDQTCVNQKFTMKQKNGSELIQITVYEYYKNKGTKLTESQNLPCLDIGKPKRPVYIPLELCELISLQRYTKPLSNLQRASLVKKSSQRPCLQRMTLMDALVQRNYNADPLIRHAGLRISPTFTEVKARVLPTPMLKAGCEEYVFPSGGRWDLSSEKSSTKLFLPMELTCWAIVNFSCSTVNINEMCRDLIRCCELRGMKLVGPQSTINETSEDARSRAPDRVKKMFEAIKTKLPGLPKFILCILPKSKNCDIYGPWKKKCLIEFGIVTQCIAPMTSKIDDQYFNNLLLKINAKMGGINTEVSLGYFETIPLQRRTPTIIFGMHMAKGSPRRSDVPSIVAVSSSRRWPSTSCYRASVRVQSADEKMIKGLYNPVPADKDEGMIRELLEDFYQSSAKQKPQHVIIFRDGVSESQLINKVLEIEFHQMKKACKLLDESWKPKFIIIVAQKTHTKFFQKPFDVPLGTIIDDDTVCHPKNKDFYLCARNGPLGATRPIHYHVLLDEIGLSPDIIQELVHELSYSNQRSTSATSVVAPIVYSRLAAQQMSNFLEDISDAASSHSGGAGGSGTSLSKIPKLHSDVRHSMFFC